MFLEDWGMKVCEIAYASQKKKLEIFCMKNSYKKVLRKMSDVFADSWPKTHLTQACLIVLRFLALKKGFQASFQNCWWNVNSLLYTSENSLNNVLKPVEVHQKSKDSSISTDNYSNSFLEIQRCFAIWLPSERYNNKL